MATIIPLLFTFHPFTQSFLNLRIQQSKTNSLTTFCVSIQNQQNCSTNYNNIYSLPAFGYSTLNNTEKNIHVLSCFHDLKERQSQTFMPLLFLLDASGHAKINNKIMAYANNVCTGKMFL